MPTPQQIPNVTVERVAPALPAPARRVARRTRASWVSIVWARKKKDGTKGTIA